MMSNQTGSSSPPTPDPFRLPQSFLSSGQYIALDDPDGRHPPQRGEQPRWRPSASTRRTPCTSYGTTSNAIGTRNEDPLQRSEKRAVFSPNAGVIDSLFRRDPTTRNTAHRVPQSDYVNNNNNSFDETNEDFGSDAYDSMHDVFNVSAINGYEYETIESSLTTTIFNKDITYIVKDRG